MEKLLNYESFNEQSKFDLSDELEKIEKDLKNSEKKAQDEISKIINSDPKLKKDLETKSNNKETNEGIVLAAALSSGAIIELSGKILKFIGKNFTKKDKTLLSDMGESIEKFGHKVHHKIIKMINFILKPIIFWLPKNKQENISNAVFMAILVLKVSSGSLDPSDYKNITGLTEGALNSIKASEITAFITKNSKKLLELSKVV